MYILGNDHRNKPSVNISHHIATIFFHVIRTFQIYSHSDFQIYNSIINSSHQAIHYISSNYLFYNWNFVSFDHFYPFAHPLPLPFLPRHPLLLYSRRKALRKDQLTLEVLRHQAAVLHSLNSCSLWFLLYFMDAINKVVLGL